MHASLMIKNAILESGGAAHVAATLGISRISVYEWIEKNRLPADRIIPVSKLTGWKFTPHMLDAKLYPNCNDGLPLESAEIIAEN
ncbi:MAG: YdaS family helix-turn-helix protein [Janthinobacterium lividum]